MNNGPVENLNLLLKETLRRRWQQMTPDGADSCVDLLRCIRHSQSLSAILAAGTHVFDQDYDGALDLTYEAAQVARRGGEEYISGYGLLCLMLHLAAEGIENEH